MDFEDTNTEELTQDIVNTTESASSEEVMPQYDAPVKEKQGFFSRVMNKFTPKVVEEEESPEEDTDSTETNVETFELTEDIKAAAKEAGWDDARIAKYAKEDPEILNLLFNQYTAEPELVENVDAPKVTETKPIIDKVEISSDALASMKEQYGDDVVDNVISPLVDKLNKVVEVLAAQDASSQATHQAVNNVVQAEREKGFQQKLDMLDEQLPVFGKWENVPRDANGQVNINSPQFKARAEVWVTAQSLQKAGYDWDRALENSIAMYKGKHLDSIVKSQVIKDLNKRKEVFTNRPTHKKTKPVKLEGKAAGVKAIREAAQSIGLQL